MNYAQIEKFREKLYFTVEDAAEISGVSRASARVMCSRYTAEGIFIRIKRNFYVLKDKLKGYERNDFMKLSNYLQPPSYISLTTALMEWGVTSQVQVNIFEACCIRRTKRIQTGDISFKYYKLAPEYYSAFIKKDGVFIAEKEKALLDSLYLYSFGKYSLDFAALEIGKFDIKRIKELESAYPGKTRKIIRKICGI